jgi:hypothetical protein
VTLNRFALILFVAVVAGAGAQPAPTSSTVDQLYAARQYELADAYWAAGQKFIDLGQADRGAEFQARAKALFPGYVPGQAPKVTVAAPVQADPQLPTMDAVLQKNLQGEKIARLQFQKLLRGYLTGTAATVATTLGATVTVQGAPSQPTPDAVAAFLQAHPAEAGSPQDLFDLDSLTVTSAGQTVTLTVQANPQAPSDLAALFTFWKPKQTYTFDRVGDTWKLTAVSGE